MSAYKAHNLHVAESAEALLRDVTYEVPYHKKVAAKAQSTIETRDEKVAAELADVCYRNAVGRERKIKDDIGTYRTVSATLRSEYEHTA